MKRIFLYCLLMIIGSSMSVRAAEQLTTLEADMLVEELVGIVDDDASLEADSLSYVDRIVIPDPEALFDSLPQPKVNNDIVNLSFVPRVFAGYRKIHGIHEYSKQDFFTGFKAGMKEIPDSILNDDLADIDTLGEEPQVDNPVELIDRNGYAEVVNVPEQPQMPNLLTYERPEWFKEALLTRMAQEDLHYSYMIDHPMNIEYAYWDLPLPPVLLEEDRSFLAFLRKQDIPELSVDEAILPAVEVRQIHWLHTVNGLLQLSQAFVSPNWYQGGNNYLSILFGFNWKVDLNKVYHPKLLFQSDFSYKLAMSSNPSGYKHKYTISEDLLQYNLNAGLKAAKDWYYSFNLQFKTQLLNNFEQNSDVRTASFLSPGDLNLGLGMSYNHTNKLKTFTYTLTISPLSYNLKTCISDKVNHATYNIPLDKKTKSEIGSNLEFNMDWAITTNIKYKTKVFMFTDYHYYLADWQNTISFEINKFLSTQLFINLRYDGSSESEGKWKKFMMREILSFGLSYTFSTKP